ncbi:MAG: glycosyltransferase family 2 protein [Caldimonas sp.]
MVRIALVLIARNEAGCIQRCLASARPWVDDLLVLDTGSTDATIALARSAGARVESFRWIDDFAAARNRALELADADWNLVLDADEYLTLGGAEVAALRGTAPGFVGAIRVDSELDAAGSGTHASSWISRVLPRGVHYAGLIHEQPVHRLAVRRLAVHASHEGYRPQALLSKQGRNRALLERALQVAPSDGYLLYQLGKDHSVYARHEEAAACYERAAASTDALDPCAHDLLVRWLFALKKCGRHEQAVALAESHMSTWQGSPDYWFTVADLLLDWSCEQPAQATALLPMIEASWQRCLEIGERPDLEGAVHGRGSFLAARNLALLSESLGRTEEARHWLERSAMHAVPGGAEASATATATAAATATTN